MQIRAIPDKLNESDFKALQPQTLFSDETQEQDFIIRLSLFPIQ